MLIITHIFDISSTQHVGVHLHNTGLWFSTELHGKKRNISKMYKKKGLIITNCKRVPAHRFITNTSPCLRHAYTAETKQNSRFNNFISAQTVRKAMTYCQQNGL
jgi:hypothetical protein